MNKKIKKYKVGLDSETYKVSMVSEPAIEIDYVALEAQKEEVTVRLSSDERHMCYGPALIPEKDIYRNNGETEYYISFGKESITKMSQDFMKNYRQHEVNLQHEENADEVFITESWIVEDSYQDKAHALGFDVPEGTWMIGMKVNNIDVWDRVKSGELKGFSVESAISLEEFESQIDKNENNMNIETNDEMFFDKIKNVFKEVLASVSMSKKTEDVALEQEPTTTVSEPTVAEPTTVVEEPQAVEPTVQEPTQEPEPQAVEEPKAVEDDKHLEELINSMKSEIEALKNLNSELNGKIKNLEKQPSTKPTNTNGGNGNNGDTFEMWREHVRKLMQ